LAFIGGFVGKGLAAFAARLFLVIKEAFVVFFFQLAEICEERKIKPFRLG
jgi:hypothetical protein